MVLQHFRRRPSRLVAALAVVLALQVVGVSSAAGVTVKRTWSASIGTGGANGVTRLYGYVGGTGFLSTSLVGIAPMLERVIHARPSRLQTATSGTTNTEADEWGSKENAPKATGPEPTTARGSSTSAAAKRSSSHAAARSNRSSPGPTSSLAASPQLTAPSPPRIHIQPSGTGIRAMRSPGSSISSVRDTRASLTISFRR